MSGCRLAVTPPCPCASVREWGSFSWREP